MSAADGILAGAYGIAAAVRALAPLSAVKTLDQASNIAALADDAELAVNVQANTRYLVIQIANYKGAHGTPGDLHSGWSGPAGAIFPWNSLNFPSSGTVGIGNITLNSGGIGDSLNSACNSATAATAFLMFGTLTVAATAGTFKYRFSRLNGTDNSGTATTVMAGSVLAAFPL